MKVLLNFILFVLQLVGNNYSLLHGSVLLCVLIVFNLVVSKREMVLLYLFILISVIPFVFIGLGYDVSAYDLYDDVDLYREVITCYSIFIFIFSTLNINSRINLNVLPKVKNDIYYYIILMVMLFIILFGKTGEMILTEGYGHVEGSVQFLNLSINEYFFHFLIICLFLYRHNLWVYILSAFFGIKNLLFGGRIEVIQLLFIYVLYFRIDLKTIKNIFLAIFAIQFFNFMGIIRSSGLLVALSNNLNFFAGFGSEANLLRITSTFGEVAYSSVTLHGVLRDSLVSGAARIEATLTHLLTYFVPYSLVSSKANIIVYVQELSPHQGGTFISSYFFFFGGFITVFIFSMIYGMAYRFLVLRKTVFSTLATILIFATVPRWLVYNHITFFKSAIYLFILFIALGMFSRNIKMSQLN